MIMANMPIFGGHPVAWVNPVTMRASAALAGAGAWDATPTEQNIAGAGSFTLQFTYTRGAAGGAFDFQIEYSIYSIAGNVPAGAGEWADMTLYAAGAVALGADSQSRVQDEYVTFGSQGAAAETLIFGPIETNHTIERIRIPARESADGDINTPGTLAIVMECYP